MSRTLLADVTEMLAEFIEGERCDHDVNICYCHQRGVLADLRALR